MNVGQECSGRSVHIQTHNPCNAYCLIASYLRHCHESLLFTGHAQGINKAVISSLFFRTVIGSDRRGHVTAGAPAPPYCSVRLATCRPSRHHGTVEGGGIRVRALRGPHRIPWRMRQTTCLLRFNSRHEDSSLVRSRFAAN